MLDKIEDITYNKTISLKTSHVYTYLKSLNLVDKYLKICYKTLRKRPIHQHEKFINDFIKLDLIEFDEKIKDNTIKNSWRKYKLTSAGNDLFDFIKVTLK